MFNYEKIYNATGLQFSNDKDVIAFLYRHVEYLETHNKNYTNAQYGRVVDALEILNSFE